MKLFQVQIIFRGFQMVSIHLAQDEIDCLGAWVSAKEAGLLAEDEPDQKSNNIFFRMTVVRTTFLIC